ncbi:MAG: molecular chaperone HtpG [Candidatus Hydrogenedentes bacterium]|nr:molecular chaperone HtpG [Candidatus Hydrogenedentota bacterium]
MSTAVETYEFQTETRQLLDLMIHSIYSNKDIFLRELISNSSDALDRLRFEALSKPELLSEGQELHILLETDSKARTITVVDNGIGMSRDELIRLVGTIAKSGTKEFMKALQASKDKAVAPELIGQFGVGFYSSFMVADKVTLVTRRAGEHKATRWESTGDGTYTLEETERAECGTSVTLHLKPADHEDGLHDYTAEWTVRNIVKKYSDFVAYPIKMSIERKEVERDDDGKPKPGAEEKTVTTIETLNSMKAIWLRDKDEVSQDELNEFYKHISHDWTDPLKTIRAKIEGTLEYRVLLFIPSKAPHDLFMREGHRGIHLYVRRVFIMDDCKDLLPDYLRFIRGVVDSEDLSLNVSRELLQQNRQIQRMRKGLISKVLDTLGQMRDQDTGVYEKFWGEFGRVMKEGLFQDAENREKLLGLLQCPSTNSPADLTFLKDYVSRMKEGQDKIYFITGESRRAVENSPHLEAFRDKGYEVLLLTDPVDEVWVQSVFEFQGKQFHSVGKGAVDLGTDEEKKKSEETRKDKEKEFGSLLECLKSKLDEYIKEVRLSTRLTSSPACLVSDEFDPTPQLEMMMKAMNQEMPKVKRILEINPNHPILAKLNDVFAKDKNAPELGDYAELLYGQAVLAEDGQLPDPGGFAKRVAELMLKAIPGS